MSDTLFEIESMNGAEFSPCRTWRYTLWRFWGTGKIAAFIGLNPSTADETKDDPTIRRCIGFAKDWGCGGIYMLNLFAFRATMPSDMRAANDPIGPDNDKWITETLAKCELAVAAWGVHGIYQGRNELILPIINRRVECLGATKAGHPKHPLYLPSNTQRELFWEPTSTTEGKS